MDPDLPPDPAEPTGDGAGDGAGTGTDAVAEAFRAVDRRGFLPRSQRPWWSDDRPLPIGHGQTCSQPSTVAAMLRLLRVPSGGRVLDVGAGSGWTTALLARLVGPAGTVLGVERVPEIAAWGAANLARTGIEWARLLQARPGVLGSPRTGGWDRVLVSAAADELPGVLVDQIAPGGRMVVPVRHTMVLVERAPDGTVRTSEHGTYSFVPLVEG
ncbi:protein-L-isoaspartate O-methyltransferase family protein [Isoptericola aurantiacus]|uniref:protein-L-isoaspartate O-methyltransferase family protein n=1 Tax=Isoptericola aurantiacus TaxID=3377839 RepID=UPI00383AA1FC